MSFWQGEPYKTQVTADLMPKDDKIWRSKMRVSANSNGTAETIFGTKSAKAFEACYMGWDKSTNIPHSSNLIQIPVREHARNVTKFSRNRIQM